MDEQIVTHDYETPRVIDYGSLQDLTADCGKASGGDAAFPGAGSIYGVSNPTYGCKSNP
jgi:hypothetical protein